MVLSSVAPSKGPDSSLAEAASAAASPRELQRLAVCSQGVGRKKPGVVPAPGCEYCELSSLAFSLLLFRRQRTNKRK